MQTLTYKYKVYKQNRNHERGYLHISLKYIALC